MESGPAAETAAILAICRQLRPQSRRLNRQCSGGCLINDQLEAKYLAPRRASTWLQEKKSKELRQQASTAERAVLDLNKANNIVDTGGRLIGEQQGTEAYCGDFQERL